MLNPINTELKSLQCDNYKVHYFVTGNKNGEAIAFLHPAFADHRCFNKQLSAFSETNLVITIDMLGHGLTQPDSTIDRIDKTADHLKQILEIEGYKKAHIVGVSIGSLLAQYVAVQYPLWVQSLTLLGGYDISADNKQVLKAQRSEGLKWMFKVLFSMKSFRNYISKVSVNNTDSKADYLQMTQSFTRKSFMYMSGMKNVLKKRENASINIPLLILVGENDIELARQEAQKMHQNHTSSKFYIIPNAGHVANMDNAAFFNNTLSSFLQAI